MSILVTGGCGYLGSHFCAALAYAGLNFVIIDNFSNSRKSTLIGLERLVGRSVVAYEGDVGDQALVEKVLSDHRVSAVVHFAAYKSVKESFEKPLDYFQNNVSASLSLLRAMENMGVGTLVFSSSATVYASGVPMPVREESKLSVTSPYGWSKLTVEEALAKVAANKPHFWRVAILRYFNPVGAHSTGLIGEDPLGEPSNLMPFVVQVAAGIRPVLHVWGNDYDTSDGTGVRDYIHVMDLADGHLAALDYLRSSLGVVTVNLGTGTGVSVLELVDKFEEVNGVKVPLRYGPRRVGDVPECWAEVSLAKHVLGWRATRALGQMCADAWRWQRLAK